MITGAWIGAVVVTWGWVAGAAVVPGAWVAGFWVVVGACVAGWVVVVAGALVVVGASVLPQPTSTKARPKTTNNAKRLNVFSSLSPYINLFFENYY